MRVSINANLSFGLVNIPVGVSPTINKAASISFKTLHDRCLTPIKQNKHCSKCGVDVETTVKGYEYSKGKFLVVSDVDLQAITPERSSVIGLTKFVPRTTADYVTNANYWLVPQEAFASHYGTLHTAMMESRVFAVGTSTLWGKEHPCVVEYRECGLLLGFLTAESEVVKPDFVIPVPDEKATKLAVDALKSFTGRLEVEDTESTQNNRLNDLIRSLISGEKIEMTPAAECEPTVDLMAALRDSIKSGEKSKKVA